MSNKQAPTAKQKAERARRFQMGIALVRSPLKHIKARTNTKETDSITGVVTFHESNESRHARHAASRGNGEMVKRIARSIA